MSNFGITFTKAFLPLDINWISVSIDYSGTQIVTLGFKTDMNNMNSVFVALSQDAGDTWNIMNVTTHQIYKPYQIIENYLGGYIAFGFGPDIWTFNFDDTWTRTTIYPNKVPVPDNETFIIG